ncbi:MAG TPA: hypothetical protein VJ436_14950 [Anaerolineales bacterium]|nr:hypothetical protein [Anaerolineales bacterium]
MERTLTFTDRTEDSIHDFENSMKHQAAADRRSVVLGMLALVGGLSVACLICAGLAWISF